ncbi:MAG: hypothetical protein ACJA0M_001945 [Chitinophagales bacterium]|jgi:hypothetical protein
MLSTYINTPLNPNNMKLEFTEFESERNLPANL